MISFLQFDVEPNLKRSSAARCRPGVKFYTPRTGIYVTQFQQEPWHGLYLEREDVGRMVSFWLS